MEDRILARLYDRIGIFEQSIGNLEAILGETMSDLQRAFVHGELTPEEADRRVGQAANAINRERSALDQLEEQASELLGHEDYIRDEMNRVRKLGRYISEESILALLQTYFESHYAAEERENRALYVRRQNALQAEHDHDVRVKQQRLDTARFRGRTRILPAMQGQIDKAKSEHRAKLDTLKQMQE